MDIKSSIKTIPDFPKEGIQFRDITSLISNPEAFNTTIQEFKKKAELYDFDAILGLESRGFIFGAPLALALNKPFILVRKKGKLPRTTISEKYSLEYGEAEIEVHTEDLEGIKNVLIIDDLLATGGTAQAACNLVNKLDVAVSALFFVIELPDLHGRRILENYNIESLVEFSGE